MPKKRPIKTIAWITAAAATVFGLGFYVVCAIVLPLRLDSGMGNLADFKRELALRAQGSEIDRDFGSDDLAATHHIERIRPTTAQEAAKYCSADNPYSSDPNDPRHYTVVVRTMKILSFGSRITTYDGCRLMPGGASDPRYMSPAPR